jgi:hypothetical protein
LDNWRASSSPHVYCLRDKREQLGHAGELHRVSGWFEAKPPLAKDTSGFDHEDIPEH